MRSGLLLIFLCFCTFLSAQEIKKKRGTVKLHHANGKISAKGKVKHYHRVGLWKFWDEAGLLHSTVNYTNDTVNGAYTEFYPNGKVFTRGEYCMNRKCGNWKTYDDTGRMISDENFSGDRPEGIQRYWYPNGRLRDSAVFKDHLVAFHEMWYSGGSVKTVELYENGLAEGKWVVYPEVRVDTFASTVDYYHQGKKHGWHYYWNGASLIEAYHYTDGLPDGSFTRYAYDGTPVLIQNYSKGKLEGVTTYFKDGLKLKVETYSNNVKEGEETEYDRSERVSKRSWYDSGSLDSSHTYHRNGKIAIRRFYEGMDDRSNYTEWDSSGVLLMKGMMHGENRDGEWKTFYPNGTVRSVTHYSDGKMVGLFTKYYPNGKKMIEYAFLPVGTNTQPDVWNEKGKRLRVGTKEYDEIVEGNRPGEMFSDPTEFNRPIIQRRVEETAESIENLETNEDIYGPTTELPPEFFGLEEPLGEAVVEDSVPVYSVCDQPAEFPGGYEARTKFIYDNLYDPRDIKDQRAGTVFIEYVVETDGTVSNVKVVKGIPGSPDLDTSARDVVSKFPAHTPGKIGGRVVRSRVIVPIRFVLR